MLGDIYRHTWSVDWIKDVPLCRIAFFAPVSALVGWGLVIFALIAWVIFPMRCCIAARNYRDR